MADYEIKVSVRNVADGDVTDIAQKIWDDNADACDAERGDFDVSISRGGFPMDWTPTT